MNEWKKMSTMDISLKMLQYFKKVAETQHITNASKELYISQPQLTRVIAELEKELGVTLFDREGKGIRLNACGEAFYRYANEMLVLAERAKTTVNEVYQHELAQLTVAANVLSYLPSILRRFRDQCPDARFRQITATREQISEMLMDRRADFGLYCFPPDTPELKSELVFTDYSTLLYPKGHPFSKQKSVTVEELLDQPIIFVSKGFGPRDTVDRYLGNYTFRYVAETMEPLQLFGYVNEGIGIAPMPLSTVLCTPALQAQYVDLEDSPPLDIHLVWKADKEFTEVDAIFVQVVKSYFQKLKEMLDAYLNR